VCGCVGTFLQLAGISQRNDFPHGITTNTTTRHHFSFLIFLTFPFFFFFFFFLCSFRGRCSLPHSPPLLKIQLNKISIKLFFNFTLYQLNSSTFIKSCSNFIFYFSKNLLIIKNMFKIITFKLKNIVLTTIFFTK
jgi:hypothetical protein